MAFQLTSTLPTMVTGNYWRIDSINLDRRANTVTVKIGLFKDHDSKYSGAEPLTERTYTWSLSAPSDLVASMYTTIGSFPEWASALNV